MLISVYYVRQNFVSFTIFIFLSLFLFTTYIKPNIVYNKDGTLRINTFQDLNAVITDLKYTYNLTKNE